MALLMILITCFMAILATSQPCQTPEDFVAVTSPGHIMIGGLFAIHEKMLSSEDESRRPQIQKCVGFEVSAFLQTLAMIHSIEMINNSTLLSGVKLGYEIYDTCTEVTAAMAATLRFLSKFNCSRETVEFQCDYSNYMPRVKAVIGAGYSEITMAVSRMLNLQLIPQVSYESTAEILSDKIRFPSFLRTVPSDFYQTKAMAHLIQKSGWNWIGIITTDDDYGRLALDTFAIQAAANNVCIAFKEVFPAFLSDNTIEVMINQTLEKIIAEAQVNVIVVFLRRFHVFNLFNKAIERNIHKIWIASDNWSTATKIITIPNVKKLGKVVGFTFRRGNISSFHAFLQTLHTYPNDNNKPLREYAILFSDCEHVKDSDLSQCISNRSQGALTYKVKEDVKRNFFMRNDFLWHYTEPGLIHSIQLAVFALGYAIRDLCQARDCQNPNAFQPWEQTLSKCSKECSPGEMKKTTRSQHICCYECVSCPENHYSNQTDMDHCVLCNNETHWAPVRSAMCLEKEVEYLNWNDSLALLLVALSLLGIIFVLAIGIIFTRNLNTPVVKSSGGLVVCYVILLCHFLNFASTGFFIGEPQDFTCKTRQTLFGVSFTLCISCILMKSLKILLAFSFDPNLQNFLKCLYKPIPIIFTCTGIQVIICILWLIFAAPTVEENVSLPRVIILECEEGSTLAFGTMLGYIAILAFICFIFAFKGRKLPENYNEAKFITFGMLIYFIAWITFIPVYATTFGKYLPAVEIIVILISNYGILCCTFFPKCYVILCKQETNTKSAFLELIYSYSSHSAGNLAMSHASLDSISSNITTTHPSPRGNSAAWQKSKDLQVQPFAQTCRDNGTKVSKTFPRKRISSI
ncbi:G protein-coupled receptor class C group 6 member A, transcript variant X2 [Ictidomys tridecemlineatus]|uniref:G-protein coupled receptor family C group 6 member A isoform X2 n=1 Tax=Ictidomys tridecemlineatus TaxID=43179 RepID=UPI00038BFD8C|nr:G-protein coupled receptor family C group 6 member A isoform X2 [Ictidomys tridecemlineatus]KAG3290119.1 G protein-coupled receptor class C group 6 member A, transcript variant X2 [Ictidomys tridecemlineatus]